jgi:hypothetical protein
LWTRRSADHKAALNKIILDLIAIPLCVAGRPAAQS